MCGRPNTTIGFERLYVPLARMERVPFVSTLTESVPARPLNMVAIEATNRGVADMPWVMLHDSTRVLEIGIDEVERRIDSSLLLDVREQTEYGSGHVPGAVNIPQAELASRLEEIPRDRPIVTICQVGSRSRRAAQFLHQMGFEDVRSVDGGTEAWDAAGRPLSRQEETVEGPRIVESEWVHAGAGVH